VNRKPHPDHALPASFIEVHPVVEVAVGGEPEEEQSLVRACLNDDLGGVGVANLVPAVKLRENFYPALPARSCIAV